MAGLPLLDRIDITDVIHAFYRLVDNGQASRTAALFTTDATLTFGPGSPQPGTISGAAIAEAMSAREALTSAFTRHVVTNITFAPAEDGAATHYILTLFRSDDDSRSSMPAFVADVAEIWVQDSGQWKINARTVMPAFARG